MFYSIQIYFLLFIIYAFLGWIVEICTEIYHTKKFVNRGFLIGPICPIYGYASLLMTLLLKNFYNSPILLFFIALFICSILEYITSYLMEKIFHARWWDYSHQKFNINGRICLSTMIPFGVLGCFIMYVTNPFILELLHQIPKTILLIVFIVIAMIYAVDTILSFVIIFGFRNTVHKIRSNHKDYTEELTNMVKEALLNRSIFSKRLIHAFPRFETRIKNNLKKQKHSK